MDSATEPDCAAISRLLKYLQIQARHQCIRKRFCPLAASCSKSILTDTRRKLPNRRREKTHGESSGESSNDDDELKVQPHNSSARTSAQADRFRSSDQPPICSHLGHGLNHHHHYPPGRLPVFGNVRDRPRHAVLIRHQTMASVSAMLKANQVHSIRYGSSTVVSLNGRARPPCSIAHTELIFQIAFLGEGFETVPCFVRSFRP